MKKRSMSNSLMLNVLMAFSGGLQDAYTYLIRGKIFANTQTGNLCKIGIEFLNGNYEKMLFSFIPVICFWIGAYLSSSIRFRYYRRFHWRQISVLVEIFLLSIVAYLPLDMEVPAVGLVALSCGIQAITFNKVGDYNYASTFFTGNLRNMANSVADYHYAHGKGSLHRARLLATVTFAFILGAVAGKIFVDLLGIRAILMSVFLLIVAFMLMLPATTAW